MKVLLVADIYDTEIPYPSSYKQEWDSKDSIEFLRDTIWNLGLEVEIIEPIQSKIYFLQKILAELQKRKKEELVLFNLVEGFFSPNREAYVPALAEFLGLPFCGSPASAQILSLDKTLTASLAIQLGIRVPHFKRILDKTYITFAVYPCFVKPEKEGSSLGISNSSIIYSEKELNEFIQEIESIYFPLRVEEYLPGIEYTVGVLGTSDDLHSTPVCRLEVEETVYSEKVKSKYSMTEKFIAEKGNSKIKEISLASIQIGYALGMSGYGRMDWKEDREGNPVFLEANLTPGLSYRYSSLPILYLEMGYSYSDLIKLILESSQREYRKSHFRIYGKLG